MQSSVTPGIQTHFQALALYRCNLWQDSLSRLTLIEEVHLCREGSLSETGRKTGRGISAGKEQNVNKWMPFPEQYESLRQSRSVLFSSLLYL